MMKANQTKASMMPSPHGRLQEEHQMSCVQVNNAWPVAHDAYEKVPGVPPGVSAYKPNGFSRKNIIKTNQSPAGSCSSCMTKMKVSSDHTKVKHLTKGVGKQMTSKASIKVMKDEHNDVVRLTRTQAVTI